MLIYYGGGFGSKGAGSIQSAIPALLSKKAGKPVMMRNARDEENAEHPAAPDKILLLRNRLTRSEWSDGAP